MGDTQDPGWAPPFRLGRPLGEPDAAGVRRAGPGEDDRLRPRVLDLRRTEAPRGGVAPVVRTRPVCRIAVATFDASGRVGDHRLTGLLGWTAGTRVDIDPCDGGVAVCASQTGAHTLNRRTMITVAWPVRRRCGFHECEQVLLVAEPTLGALFVLGVELVDRALPDLAGLVRRGGPAPAAQALAAADPSLGSEDRRG